ncbi:transcriptional regulator [Psychromonas sp. RZ22]|uniref:Rho-binding antiterminator n=1 Tax=Psychromonas algarum TaxID=2555643 RepID=UPI0010673232|nr:Rho-binding antiterminator [Psychromonas sp. RZ22]TEW56516.1 transcriptional regulator [Psychromonas sp. RZ22]
MISCHHYDYIEIVCMHQYPIKITTKSDVVIYGIALDTQRNESCEECIKVNINAIEKLVLLDDIVVLEVTVENPHFQIISFMA